jgi:zinc and cadmium transporter
MPRLAMILLCAAFGGIASAAVAVVFLWVREQRSDQILPHFISFATGALLGAALLALLPEAIETAGPQQAHAIGATVVLGLGFFFVIEKLVLWWHTHGSDTAAAHHHGHEHSAAHEVSRQRASGILVLVGDSLHNALDGVLIAAAFLTSSALGILTTFAVAAHEIPHRVGDFAILVQAGFSRPRALLFNLATGFASLIGALVAYYALRQSLAALPYAVAFAAAGFLYIAVAGLIPGLHRRSDPRSSAVQVLLIAMGIAVIALAGRFMHE